MTTIELYTTIKAPIETVFNLSRDIDFHKKSASQTNETAIAGKTNGLIGLNETVTWRGKHFSVYLTHTSKIIALESPNLFTDVMIKGHFTYFVHQHFFKEKEGNTLMIDILKYKVPYGIVGQIFNKIFLKKHLQKFLTVRNQALKKEATL